MTFFCPSPDAGMHGACGRKGSLLEVMDRMRFGISYTVYRKESRLSMLLKIGTIEQSVAAKRPRLLNASGRESRERRGWTQ